MTENSPTNHGPWVAVVNHGRWIAECPRPRCKNAFGITPGTDGLLCETPQGDGCGYAGRVEWPRDAAAIITELLVRPVAADRNWAPAGHRQTHHSLTPGGRIVADAFPEGQDVADLRAENREIEANPPRATPKEELVVKANDALASLGFSFDPDTEQLRRL